MIEVAYLYYAIDRFDPQRTTAALRYQGKSAILTDLRQVAEVGVPVVSFETSLVLEKIQLVRRP
jgi:hypothetical protein